MTTQQSLIRILDVCDNFRPHLSPEPLVPFLLAPNIRPALGLLRPPVVAALRTDNAWRRAHGTPPAWDIPASPSAGPDSTSNGAHPPPYIAFAPALADGPPAARTRALAETLERWRADANRGGGGGAFAGVLGGKRWRDEFWDVYRVPGGTLRADGRDPLTVLEAPGGGEPGGKSADGPGGYVLSVERAAAKLFGVITFGVHMTVYEQKGGAGVDADVNAMRVWVPRRAATKPTYVHVFARSSPLGCFSHVHFGLLVRRV
jgi:hypothetical protein